VKRLSPKRSEVPQHRAIAPDSELKAVTIAEDVILVFCLDCLDCLELAVGKGRAGAGMRATSNTVLVFQKTAPDGLEYHLEYPNGWNSKNLSSDQ